MLTHVPMRAIKNHTLMHFLQWFRLSSVQDYYGEWVIVAAEKDPTTMKEALGRVDKDKWKTVMKNAINAKKRCLGPGEIT